MSSWLSSVSSQLSKAKGFVGEKIDSAKQTFLRTPTPVSVGFVTSAVMNPKGTAGVLLQAGTRWVCDKATKRLEAHFDNGSTLSVKEKDGEVHVELQPGEELEEAQDTDGQLVVSEKVSRAKKALKIAVPLLTFATAVHQRRRLASALPPRLASLIGPENMAGVLSMLKKVTPKPAQLLEGASELALAALPDVNKARQAAQDMAVRMMRATYHAIPKPVKLAASYAKSHPILTLGGTASAVAAHKVALSVVQRYRAAMQQARIRQAAQEKQQGLLRAFRNMQMAVELKHRSNQIKTQTKAQAKLAKWFKKTQAAKAARSVQTANAQSVIARAFRARRSIYSPSDLAEQLDMRLFETRTMTVEAPEEGASRFGKLCVNGRVTGKAHLQEKVAATKVALGGLLSPEFRARLEADQDFGFTLDCAREKLVIALPEGGDNEHTFVRHEYDLTNSTSIAEFLDRFGGPDVSEEQVKAFLTEQQGVYGVSPKGELPVATVGNYNFDVSIYETLFSSSVLTDMEPAQFKSMLLQMHAKMALVRDYVTQLKRSDSATPAQIKAAEDQLALLREINLKRMLEMARFLEHTMRIKKTTQRDQQHTTQEAMSVREIITLISEGRLSHKELAVTFAKLIDYAKTLVDQDPAFNITLSEKPKKAELQREQLEQRKKAKVSELANLFIGVVYTQAKESNSPELALGVQLLRTLQKGLIKKGELIALHYGRARMDLEAEMAYCTYDAFEDKIRARLAEQLDEASFDESVYTQAEFDRMRAGLSAAPVAGSEADHLLASITTTLQRESESSVRVAPRQRLQRETNAFARRIQALHLEALDPTQKVSGPGIIRDWITTGA